MGKQVQQDILFGRLRMVDLRYEAVRAVTRHFSLIVEVTG
jgi:hypothetical protein